MAQNLKLIQGKQINVNLTGSFTGSFTGNGSGLTNLPVQNINTGSLVTTSSFNAFTSSYNTGSFTGSFSGSLFGTASFAISSSRAVTSSFAISSSRAVSAATASYSLTLGANIGYVGGAANVVGLYNSSGSLLSNITVNNVTSASYAERSDNATNANSSVNSQNTNVLNGFQAATIDQINVGQTNSGDYAYILRTQELEQSKHTTINIYNNLNFT
jgi:hypothetical protein